MCVHTCAHVFTYTYENREYSQYLVFGAMEWKECQPDTAMHNKMDPDLDIPQLDVDIHSQIEPISAK